MSGSRRNQSSQKLESWHKSAQRWRNLARYLPFLETGWSLANRCALDRAWTPLLYAVNLHLPPCIRPQPSQFALSALGTLEHPTCARDSPVELGGGIQWAPLLLFASQRDAPHRPESGRVESWQFVWRGHKSVAVAAAAVAPFVLSIPPEKPQWNQPDTTCHTRRVRLEESWRAPTVRQGVRRPNRRFHGLPPRCQAPGDQISPSPSTRNRPCPTAAPSYRPSERARWAPPRIGGDW